MRFAGASTTTPCSGGFYGRSAAKSNIRTCVLYGSMPRRDASLSSDIDLLFVVRDGDERRLWRLRQRTRQKLGRKVQLVTLDMHTGLSRLPA